MKLIALDLNKIKALREVYENVGFCGSAALIFTGY